MVIKRDYDDTGRFYQDGSDRGYSVTTILNLLDEDKTGLEIWKRINNGQGDEAHWKHLFWYKTYRGTLCHYQALTLFSNLFEDDEDMWGDGEIEALNRIAYGPSPQDSMEFQEEGASLDMDDIVYSVLKDQEIVETRDEYNDLDNKPTLLEVCTNDQEWFIDAFKNVCDKIGITEDNVIRVEKFLLDMSLGYGGQCDLLYEDPDGNTVVADLKTSSSLRQKHILQVIAYSKAIEHEESIPIDKVDRVEVIRLHPDTGTWTIHSPVKVTDYHTTQYWFKDKYGNWEYESTEAQWRKFCELAERANK